jgi:hypothetical protein
MIRFLSIAFFTMLLSIIASAQNPYAVSSYSETDKKPEKKKSAFAQKYNFINPADWKQGMNFIAIPPDGIFDLKLIPYGQYGSGTISAKKFAWKRFVFERLEEKDTGQSIKWTSFVFRCDTSLYEFLYKRGGIESIKSNVDPPSVMGLIYTDEIDNAKKELLGKYLYILSNVWYKDTEEGNESPDIQQKFVKVKVVSIGSGDYIGPVKILFESSSGLRYHKKVRLSGINTANLTSLDQFDDVFSFSDPKLKYPKISAATWSLIQKSEVKIGMSEQESILSWGEPEKINTNISLYGSSEQWVYSGRYLYFKAGKVVHIQE